MPSKRSAAGLLVSTFVFLAILLLFGPADMALAQCALCRTALESSAEGQAMAAGFNQAILFLLAAPFVVVGSGVLIFWRAGRRSQSRLEPSRPLKVGSQV